MDKIKTIDLEHELELIKFSLENANIAIYWLEPYNGEIFYANKAACESLHYSFEELTRLRVIDIDPNLDASSWKTFSQKVIDQEKETRFESLHKRKDQSIFPVEIIAKILHFEDKIYNIAFAIDITERKKAEELLTQNEKLLRESQEIANIGSWELDCKTNSLVWSEQVYKIFEVAKEDFCVSYEAFLSLVHPEDRAMIDEAYKLSLERKKPYNVVHRIICNNKIKYIEEQCKTDFFEEEPIRSVGTIRDITGEYHLSQKVEYFSNYDKLTNLPNRFLFLTKLEQLIENTPENSKSLIALCFIDLDNFKYINDTYGHHIGDEILKEFSNRLDEVVEGKGWIARFGGDEFAAVLENIKKVSTIATIAENILTIMKKPFIIHNELHHISVSIGISLYPNDTRSVADLTTFADITMHRAKESGKNRYEFYTTELTATMIKKMQLLTQLDEALFKEQFELFYQPQIDIKSRAIIGFEALIRWHHPILGFVSPADFIPIAEESKFIIPLGKWILYKACKQAKFWVQEGLFEGKRVAINVSGIQLSEDNFAKSVSSILHDIGLESKYLEIEITESSLMSNSTHSLEQLERLNALDINLAIDDFGTGYSSLAYLRKMPVRTLKIDQSFVKDLPLQTDACAIVETIITLAKTMNKRVLAEGVETKEQLKFLKNIKCEEAQGYYFAKPLNAKDATSFLRK